MTDRTHWDGCGANTDHAWCATTEQLIEAIMEIVDEAYSDGLSDGHPLSRPNRRVNAERKTDLARWMAELRRRLDGITR